MFKRPSRVLLVIAALVFTACTQSTTQTASNSPEQSPSASQAASPTPSPSPSSSPSATASATSTPTAAPGKLSVNAASFHVGEVGLAYGAVALGASGGTPPYTWSLKSGSLPAGLSVSQSGVIGGTPTGAGKPNFTVGVSDSAGGSASLNGSINIYPRLAVSALCANLCSVEETCSVCGAFGTLGGGASPFKFAVTSGAPPTGMGISGLSLTGPFPAPGPVGAFGLTMRVTDSLGVQQTITADWYVFPRLRLAVNTINCLQSSAQCVINVAYTGGTPGATPTVTLSPFNPAAGPPRGYTVSASGGNLNFQANGQGWKGTVTITLTDKSVCGPGTAHCSASVLVNISL